MKKNSDIYSNAELKEKIYKRRSWQEHLQTRRVVNWKHDNATCTAPFYLKYVAQSYHNVGWNYEHGASELSVIEIPLTGTLYVELNSSKFAVRPGYACMLPASEFNHLYCAGELKKLTFAFAGSCSSLILSSLTNNSLLFPLAHQESIMDYYRQFHALLSESDLGKFSTITGLAMQFAMELVARDSWKKLPPIMVEAQNAINASIGDSKLTASVIAHALHISVYSLNKLFLQYSGNSVSQYLKKMRMTKALHMLQEEGESVKNTAARLGYATPFAFSTAFRAFYGYPPIRCRPKRKN